MSPGVVPAENSKPHVLVASSTHRIGYGVPVVVSRHVRALLEAGFEVTVAGPSSETDFTYDGASRIDFHAPAQVAEWALSNGVDVIWAHTPPYYSVARWLGGQIPVIAYDYGEPMAWLFPDWVQREKVNHDKDLAFASCDRVYAISESVETEARQKQNGIVPLGNDHLEQWNDEFNERREILRSKRGWADSRIVLNVCRFTEEERRYKGIDRFLECMRLTKTLDIAFEDQWRFVLCGRGESSDVELLTEYGLEVYPDLPDDELVDMYTAADAYANFSKWEGYNLGIGQALALGLPVVASDNPAHRAFGIDTFADTGAAAKRLIELLNAPPPRFPRCWSWERSNQSIIDITREVIGLQPLPEHKRSLRMGKDVESSASVLD